MDADEEENDSHRIFLKVKFPAEFNATQDPKGIDPSIEIPSINPLPLLSIPPIHVLSICPSRDPHHSIWIFG